MGIFEIKNLTFTYPSSPFPRLDNINIDINKGEFVLLIGNSGSGKTTLLNHLKTAMTPEGERAGEVLYNGSLLGEIPAGKQSSEIGYVMQNPQRQTVTDKVISEMAFGLQNIATDPGKMRRSIAETSNYFGIDNIMDREISSLSGGQRQLLNLAAVAAMRPKVLIFDEPTANLDPVAANRFLQAVQRLNREAGITIIITEQRTRQIFAMADRVIVMDTGRIIRDTAPENLVGLGDNFARFLPTPRQVASRCGCGTPLPLTVKQGRQWLEEYIKADNINPTCFPVVDENYSSPAIQVKDVYFRYTKDGKDILKSADFWVPEGVIFRIIGGNGGGKSTLLKVMSGALSPYSGKVITKKGAKCAYLPQESSLLFGRDSVAQELKETGRSEEDIEKTARLCKISHLLNKHPYDLSVGQQQCVALAKILLYKADILMLDEITRGMDSLLKDNLADILKSLTKKGVTVVMVSHDIEFCAQHSDITAMLFDGDITSWDNPRRFFSENNFYTTQAARMAYDILPGAVTAQDIIKILNDK